MVSHSPPPPIPLEIPRSQNGYVRLNVLINSFCFAFFFCTYLILISGREGKKNVSQWKRSQWKNQLPLLCISTVRLSFISFYDANAFSPSRLITEWWRRDFFFSFFLSSGIKKKKSLSINSFTESVGSGDCKRRKKESKKALSNELWFSYVLVSSRVWSWTLLSFTDHPKGANHAGYKKKGSRYDDGAKKKKKRRLSLFLRREKEKCAAGRSDDVSLFNIFLHGHTRRSRALHKFGDRLLGCAGVPDWLIECATGIIKGSGFFLHSPLQLHILSRSIANCTIRFPSWYMTSCLLLGGVFISTPLGAEEKRDCLSMSFAVSERGKKKKQFSPIGLFNYRIAAISFFKRKILFDA